MAIPLTINGVTFQYPVQFDKNWGPTLTNWSSAVTTGMLQKAGGTFTLTSEVNFGSSFGLKTLYVKSTETNIAATGILRLGNASTGVVWRNAANSADLALTVNSSNQLTFNGISVGATTSLTNSHILVGNASNQPADVAMSGDITITNTGVTAIGAGKVLDANVGSGAAIALTKLAALSNSQLVVTNSSGILASLASPTLTEVGYLSGVGSAIQTQINGLLPLAGGTMTGVLNMGGKRIAAVATPTTSGDAAQYPITTAQLASGAVTQVQVSNSGSSLDGATAITTKSITTTGGAVLVLATACLQDTSAGTFHTTTVGITVTRAGTAFGGNTATAVYSGAGSTNITYAQTLTINAVDTPTAGTYTYRLTGSTSNALTALGYSLVLVELKA